MHYEDFRACMFRISDNAHRADLFRIYQTGDPSPPCEYLFWNRLCDGFLLRTNETSGKNRGAGRWIA